jgi:hypothetical protein
MNLKQLPVFLIMLTLLACGKESESFGSGTSTNQLSINESYQFISNGCDTGKREFTGEDKTQVRNALCMGLQSDSLNNWCAYSLRYKHFQLKCSGMAWNPHP